MSFSAAIDEIDAEAIAAFGEELTYTPAGDDPVTLSGIFDEAFHLSQTEGPHGAVQSTSPGCVLDASDLPDGIDGVGTEGDKITRVETDYFITGIEPSGGLVVLRLSENDPT